MSSCIPNSGQWIATSRVGAVLLAPVAVTADATGLSATATAALVGGFGFGRDEKAMAAPQTHNYTNRPGSPPRGRHR